MLVKRLIHAIIMNKQFVNRINIDITKELRNQWCLGILGTLIRKTSFL